MDEFELTEEQKDWFGNRMDEGRSGAVKVPTYLYDKYRKISDNEFIKNSDIKDILIRQCY